MLTVVTLLLLPVVLSMSVFRIVQVPRDLLLRRLKFSPAGSLVSAASLSLSYCALLAYTGFILYTAARTIWRPPETIERLFSVASVAAASPVIYGAFEWLLYYAVKPGTSRGVVELEKGTS